LERLTAFGRCAVDPSRARGHTRSDTGTGVWHRVLQHSVHRGMQDHGCHRSPPGRTLTTGSSKL